MENINENTNENTNENINENINETINQAAVPPSASGKKSNFKKKLIKIIVSVLAVSVLFGFLVYGLFRLIKNLDYMRPLKDLCNVYNSRETDVSKVYKLIYSGSDQKSVSSAYKILLGSDLYYRYFEETSDSLTAYYRENAAANGGDITMKFDITLDKHKMDEGELAVVYKEFESMIPYYQSVIDGIDNCGKDDWQKIADNLGLSLKRAKELGSIIRKRCVQYKEFNLKAGYYITGRFILVDKNGDTIKKSEKITLSIVKLNGEWCIYNGKDTGILFATGTPRLFANDLLDEIYNVYIK